MQCRRQELKVSGAKRKANARCSYSLPCRLLNLAQILTFDSHSLILHNILILLLCNLVFLYVFPIMGAYCAQISGMWIKVFVKALPNRISQINSCLAVSLPDNICISNAQYYELNAQQNLWCEILEF